MDHVELVHPQRVIVSGKRGLLEETSRTGGIKAVNRNVYDPESEPGELDVVCDVFGRWLVEIHHSIICPPCPRNVPPTGQKITLTRIDDAIKGITYIWPRILLKGQCARWCKRFEECWRDVDPNPWEWGEC